MALRIKETLLSARALDDSWRVLLRAGRGRKTGTLTAPVPWPEEVIRARLENPGRPGLDRADDAALKAQLANWVDNYSGYRLSGALRSLFRNAVADVRAAGSEVVVFVPPLSRCELEVIDQTGSWGAFQAWKREILRAGPYWDFSGYGKLDRMDSLFLDVPHVWPAVGHIMLREFLGHGCEGCGEVARIVREAGEWVDTTTIDAHLERQETRRTAARSRGDRCVKVVGEMLRAAAGGAGKEERPRSSALSRAISRLAAADWARPCFPAPSPDDAEVLDARGSQPVPSLTLSAPTAQDWDRVRPSRRASVVRQPPWGPDREGTEKGPLC